MASGGTTSSNPTAPVSISPITGILASLFGLGTQIKKGGIQLTNKGTSVFGNPVYDPNNQLYRTDGRGNNGIFTADQVAGGGGGGPFGNMPGGGGPFGSGGPFGGSNDGPEKYKGPYNAPGGVFGVQDFASIRDLLNPIGLQGFEQGVGGPGGVGQAGLDLFNQQGLPALQELLSTGFRTDMDPIRQNEMRRFRTETVPGLAEQFAAQTGTFSTDFLNSLNSAGATLHSELGALQAQMDEAASGRRAQGLLGGALDLPSSVGSNLLGLGEQYRLQQQGASAGGQALALMQALSGIVPTGAIAMSPSQQSAQGGVL